MTQRRAVIGTRIFDGRDWHDRAALIIAGARVEAILPAADVPAGVDIVDGDAALIVPGFIDLQVNGGGGVLFNDAPDVEGLARICAAHARFGTTALLATLITDSPQVTEKAVAAGRQAREQGLAGFLGLHLEGPHLARSRKGAHDGAFIRPMEQPDLALLSAAARDLDVLMVTVAPENVTQAQVRQLAEAGVIVSLGHSDAGYETAKAYMQAGASAVTHIFNAMSPLAHRAPGLVGAALDLGGLDAGLIADGIHVAPPALAIALRAKRAPGEIFVVTDAMPPIGTEMTAFHLNGREIRRDNGRLTLADGTLAGADIDMAASMRLLHREIGLPLADALRLVSANPAKAAGIGGRKGHLLPGFDADFVLLDDALSVRATFIGGAVAFRHPQRAQKA